jgi:hypothetical protein
MLHYMMHCANFSVGGTITDGFVMQRHLDLSSCSIDKSVRGVLKCIYWQHVDVYIEKMMYCSRWPANSSLWSSTFIH